MRHPIRSAIVAGTSALLLASGVGTASAQGSLELALPFPLDIPGLASLATGNAPEAPNTPETQAMGQPAFSLPEEVAKNAFAGRVVAGINEARTAVGANRLVTDPNLVDGATERAEELAEGDPETGDLDVPDDAATQDRTVLKLPADAGPQDVLTKLLSDTGTRERMLDGKFTNVGVGLATAENGEIHTVLDFERP